MAAAAQITPSESDMVAEMRGYAQRMIRAVADTGSSAVLPEVLAFQQAFNRNFVIIKSLLAKLGKSSSSYAKLVEDGRYGPKTASALFIFISVAPPTKASDMPVWYARNADMVDGLVPPTPAPVQSVLDQPPPAPVDDSSAAQQVLNSGGSVIRNLVPVQSPSSTAAPGPAQVISTTTSVVPTGVSATQADLQNAAGPTTPVAELSKADLVSVGIDTGATELPPLDIVGTAPKSRVPLIAVALGAAGLGGLMYYWAKRKRGRR
jgi:hypothetical protein